MDPEDLSKAKSYLFWLLSRRDYSRFQLERKLKIRGLSPGESDTLLSELIEKKIFREESYTHARMRQFIRKGLSRRAIESKLKSERCPFLKEEIDAAFEELGVSEKSKIMQLLRKQLEQLVNKSSLDEKKIKNKVFSNFIRKGHPYQLILEVYNQIKKEKL